MNKDDVELNDILNSAINRISAKCGESPKFIGECEESSSESLNVGKLIQWTSNDGKIFVPAGHTRSKLTPGVYEIRHAPDVGSYFERIPVKTEGLIRFPQTNSDKVVQEIQGFWEKESIFLKHSLTYKRGIMLWGPPGCHAKGTKVMMLDGSLKNIEDVVLGDLLLGPDGMERRVLELRRGQDEMFRVSPRVGDKFVVNGHHILSLRRVNNEISNISLNDYMAIPKFDQEGLTLWGITGLQTPIVAVEHIGEGEYYGFTLSYDHLYATADGIVHHNSGKSCTIQIIMQDVVERGGVVIKFTAPGLFLNGLRKFREIQPTTPAVVLMEDIDGILEQYSESEVLNILDGVDSAAEKIVYLATTNYPERLGPRIMNRPSRFDKRFKIDYPNAESRMIYLKQLTHKCEHSVDLDKWVEETDKFSLAHLKELFVAVLILGDEYDNAIETLSSMREDISSEDDEVSDKVIGFRKPKRSRHVSDNSI